ncbi:MAG: phosphonate metabolism protein/1,5-bisphosphokinase (PRPP-forming) PhnN [Bradyrhizobium sp.]
MSETPAISDVNPAAIGPGRLVLVVGPSGAGKDTLINLARAACAGDANIVFPRRVVTREATAFEDNAQVSFEAFRQARDNGEFVVYWEAHGHGYALPRAIDHELRAGRTVVANISRTVIEPMRRAYADVVVVSITAPPEILKQRLAARARGSDGPIADRLGRAVDGAAAVPDTTIHNVGNAETHAQELLRIIRGS